MKKALLAVLFSAFLPSMAMADHHRTSIGLSFGFGNSYCRGYDYGYCPPPVSYYSYSYYPAYTTYAYPPTVEYVAAPIYVAPPRIYVEPAPRVYFYESRYRDYGGRYYESDRHYRRY